MIEKMCNIFYNYFCKKINKGRREIFLKTKKCSIKVGNNFSFDFIKNIYNIGDNSTIIIGNDVKFGNYCNIWVDNNSSLTLGNNVFFNNFCSINVMGKIEIGDYTICGEGVKFFDHNHNFTDPESIMQFEGCKIGKILIGKNCWIASNVIILKDVTIGDNVIIGAGNLIYKDIPSNVVIKKKAEYIMQSRLPK